MKQFTSFFCLLLSFFTVTQAQISQGGAPYSFNSKALSSKVPTAIMPSIDIAALKAEDALNDGNKQVFRFGKSIVVDLDLKNAGKWETLSNGDRIWRLQITSKGANTINLIYKHFYLPKGAKLFLYNADHSEVLGAFTSKNNKAHRQFSTSLLKGDQTILEYYEPAKVEGQGIVHISEVIHGYRGFRSAAEKDFGSSGNCNINVNCSDGDDWQVEKRSVAMIIAGGKRDCTGALVNNVREDGTPYFLTADHCLPNSLSEVQTWLFMFNYESLTCVDEDGRTDQTVSGAELRANSSNSDFALLELSSVPPLEYQIYYAGWSAKEATSEVTTCIHHPTGDIKKITFNEDALVSSNITGTPPDSFWEVTEWEKGTTEKGSSGSPLFDDSKRIVGQLYGGFASCTNITWDAYGKFAYSWNNGNSLATRLKDWLDPDNTGTVIIDGMEGNVPDFELDASIQFITSPEVSVCGAQEISPRMLFRNVGSTSLTSANLLYSIDGVEEEVFAWEGNLEFFDSEWIDLPSIGVGIGVHKLVISIQDPNGKADMNEGNNTLEFDFEVLNGVVLKVDLNTDGFGAETSFQIEDEAGVVLVNRSNFGNNKNYDLDFCLMPGCYVFTIFDSYEGPDGLGDGICCQSGNGNYTVGLTDGTVFGTGGEFRSEESLSFCIEDKLILDAAFSVNQADICSGDAVEFTALSEGAATYAWAFEGGTPATSAEPNPTVVFEDWGDFNVSLVVTNSISTDELKEQDYIQVNGTTLGINTFNSSNPIAVDGSVELDIVSSSNMENLIFDWSNGTTTVNPGQLSRGNYSVEVKDENGCLTTEFFSIGSDIPPIVAMVQVDSRKICEGDVVHLIDVSNNDVVNRQWIFEGAAMAQSSELGVYLEYIEVGKHDVQLIVEDEYTKDTLVLKDYIEVSGVPNLEVEMDIPQLGKSDGRIKVNVTGGTPSTNYQWNTGATSSELFNLPEAIYEILVTNEFGCQKRLEIPLETNIELQDGFLFYPNPVDEGTLFFYNNNPSETPVSFKIYSLEGRMMGDWSLDGSDRNYSLDVSTIPSGIYLLWSNSGGKERQEKLILLND